MKNPVEFKVMRIRECVSPAHQIDTPEQAINYWRANIPSSPWYDEAKECLVVLILNTRKRIIGHNLVSLGGLDTCFVDPPPTINLNLLRNRGPQRRGRTKLNQKKNTK